MKKLLSVVLIIFLQMSMLQAQPAPKGNFKKNYNQDCAKCTDPWVGEIFYKIWGICPSDGGGSNLYCDINWWNGGSWNSYAHLTNIIRNKFTGSLANGKAYIFVKPENVNLGLGKAGHIGWGFQLSNGTFYCGATENYSKGNIGDYIVLAGNDNDFWAELCYNQESMFRKMKALNYTQYKIVGVKKPNIAAAKRATEEIQGKGFQGISNNCLDHTYTVLAAYGLNFFQLPSRQIFLFPNKWFNEFYPNVNGNGVYGMNL